jgi:hypothetical protein
VQADAPAVALNGAADDEPGRFEPIDVAAHGRRGHPLPRGERAHAEPGLLADRREQRHLPHRHSHRERLAAEVAIQVKQERPQPLGDRLGCRDR